MPTLEEIQKQLGQTTPTTPTGLYDIGKIQTDYATAEAEGKKAYDELIGIQTKTYETEYSAAGLGDLKTKITGIDTDISNRKATRDQALLDEKGKPIPQWMITGRKALEIEAATNDINRLIDQRNSVANQYNASIEDVTRKVGYATTDAQTKYAYWESEKSRLAELTKNYQTALTTELAKKTETEQWEKSFAVALEELELKKAAAITPEPGKAPADIETYARGILAGTYSETGVPAEIRTQVMRRVDELKKTERVYTDEQIGAEIRGWIMDIKSEATKAGVKYTDGEIKAAMKDTIIKSRLTDPDRAKFNSILDEIIPEAPAKTGAVKTLWDWLKQKVTLPSLR